MSKEHIVRPDQPVYTENNLKQLYLSTGSTQSPKDVGDSKHYQLGYSKILPPGLSTLRFYPPFRKSAPRERS
jgi:hypothetical protein